MNPAINKRPAACTLLILAAGLGSRYGGLKQLDALGPQGETMLDYAVSDAVEAGFDAVIFVIRKDFENSFKKTIGQKFEGIIHIEYAYQNLDDIPDGHNVSLNRIRPWGTAHAVWCARESIEGPFAVINADDFYGSDAYVKMSQFLRGKSRRADDLAMVAYDLEQTLSDNGSVNRGICEVIDGRLVKVEEHEAIHRTIVDGLSGRNAQGEIVALDPQLPVSMNFWGFDESFVRYLENNLSQFFSRNGKDLRAECYLPAVVNRYLADRSAVCQVLQSTSTWFGVTYPEDKASVQAKLRTVRSR